MKRKNHGPSTQRFTSPWGTYQGAEMFFCHSTMVNSNGPSPQNSSSPFVPSVSISISLATLLIVFIASDLVHAQSSTQIGYTISAFALSNDNPNLSSNGRADTDVSAFGEPIFLADGASAQSTFSMGNGNVITRASIGDIGVSATVSATSNKLGQFAGFASARATASASWNDISVFEVAGVPPGQRYIVRSALQPDLQQFELNGRAVGEESTAFMNLVIKSFGVPLPESPYGGNLWGSFDSEAFVDTQFPPALILLEEELLTGEPQRRGFSVELDGKAFVGFSGGTAEATARFANSLKWGGILSVHDAVTGVEVHDYTITSASGFDYSRSFDEQQVPEPSGAIMLLAGLSVLARRWRRLDGK